MEAIRQIVDGRLLNNIVPLPKDFLDKKVEIIVFQTDEKSDKSFSINIEHNNQQTLLKEIQELRGIVSSDIDEKSELLKARDEKYESLG